MLDGEEGGVMRTRSILVVAAAGILLSGVSSAVDSPNVKRLGATVARYKDKAFQLAVSWRYTQLHPEERWTFFETWMMPIGKGGVTINREDVSLFLPDGTELPLPSQNKLNTDFPDMRRVATVGDVARDPMESYFVARNGILRIGFQEVPGTFITYDERAMASHWAAFGDLYFENPKGKWEKGIYTFSVKNKEVDAKIPMPIGITGELERVK
jgi:hypothetical protein